MDKRVLSIAGLDGAKCDSAIEAIPGEGGYVSRDGCISGLRLPDGSEYSSRVSIPGLGAAENAAISAIVSLAVASAMKRGIRFGQRNRLPGATLLRQDHEVRRPRQNAPVGRISHPKQGPLLRPVAPKIFLHPPHRDQIEYAGYRG